MDISLSPYQYWTFIIGGALLLAILVAVLLPISDRLARWVVLGVSALFLGLTAAAAFHYLDRLVNDPNELLWTERSYPGWLLAVVSGYPYWIFGIGGALLLAILVGALVRVPDRAVRQVILGISVLLVGWSVLAVLAHLGLLPRGPWWLLLNVGLYGLLFFFGWWLVAVALVAVLLVVSKARFPSAAGH